MARQAEGIAELRYARDGVVQRVCLTNESLDLHDILVNGDRLYVVATQLNAVLELDAATYAERRRWTLPGEHDAAHLNSVCLHDGRLLATRFGQFEVHREYKDRTRGAGQVFDVETGEVLVSGLSQPHSLRSHDGHLWVCDSQARTLRIYRGYEQVREARLEAYVRGLAFRDDEVFVGLSRGRNDASAQVESAGIAVLGIVDLERRCTIRLPVDEVYDLQFVKATTRQLDAIASQETEEAYNSLRHARNQAALDAHRQHQLVISHATELHAANLRCAELQRQIVADEDALRRCERDALHVRQASTEGTLWAEMLERELTAVRAESTALREAMASIAAAALEQERGVHEREEFIAMQARLIEQIRSSRSWRLTRFLRQARRSDPEPLNRLLPPGGSGEGARETQAVIGEATTAVAAAAVRSEALRAHRHELPITGLRFDRPLDPQVSIIVTAFGNFAETLACLRAIRDAGDLASFEVLLVDDCSNEAEMQRFSGVPGLDYRRNESNLGFLRSANAAAMRATGEYLHFLNNDTLVQPGWLDAMLQTYQLFHQCGLVGSRLIGSDGRLQEAGGIVWSDGNGCNYGRGEDPDQPSHQVVREVDYVSGASLLIHAGLWRQLEGFDERYVPAYYEDTDLAFRVREAGLRVYMQAASRVVHAEGLSHGTDPLSGGKVAQARNRVTFNARWGHLLAREQLLPGEHAFLARDRAQLARTVLVVDRYPPEPDQDAGSRAMWQLMRVLSLHDWRIKFWSHERSALGVYADSLRAHGIEVLDEETSGPFECWMERHGCYVDGVVLSRPLVAHACITAVRRHTSAPVIFYGHDVHHLRLRRQYGCTGIEEQRIQADWLEAIEKELWAASDLVLYPSAEETAAVGSALRAQGSLVEAKTIPLFAYDAVSIDQRPVADQLRGRSELLFVGGFGHAPNADGMLWFMHEVWPRLVQRQPGLTLCIIGATPPEELLALASSRVEVLGQVSEEALVARYARARVALAPLRFGAGTKGKVIEALRHGVPCVSTPIGAQGIDGDSGLIVVDTSEEMADAVVRLAEDQIVWSAAATAGQRFVRERYSRATVWDTLRAVLPESGYLDVQSRREAMRDREECVMPGSV